MIYGIGVDILNLERMDNLRQKHPQSVHRLLSSFEQAEYQALSFEHQGRFLAKRFAAKESLAKALRCGFCYPVSLSQMTLAHRNGAPEWRVSDVLRDWLNARNITALHVSLSDEKDSVIAFSIAECD